MRVSVETGDETRPFSILDSWPLVKRTRSASLSRVTLRCNRRLRIRGPINCSTLGDSSTEGFAFLTPSSFRKGNSDCKRKGVQGVQGVAGVQNALDRRNPCKLAS